MASKFSDDDIREMYEFYSKNPVTLVDLQEKYGLYQDIISKRFRALGLKIILRKGRNKETTLAVGDTLGEMKVVSILGRVKSGDLRVKIRCSCGYEFQASQGDLRKRKNNVCRNHEFRVVDGKKKCSSCSQTKLVEYFYEEPRATAGISAICIECTKEDVREYQLRYPEKVKARRVRRVTKKRGLITLLPNTYWKILLEVCGSACLRCGETEGLTHDHVIPIMHDEYDLDFDSLSNAQVLCFKCNASKGNRSREDFRSDSMRAELVLREMMFWEGQENNDSDRDHFYYYG